MCSTKKSALQTFLLKNLKEADPSESTRIINGGALLWCCDCKRNETFQKICEKYSNFLSYHSVDIIVFDGYAPSTKDTTHWKKSGTFFQIVDIKNKNPCTSHWSKFFSNFINKANFLKFLAEKLEKNFFNIIQWPRDTDTTIVKTALTAAKDSPVHALADDTDILSLLIYHMTNGQNRSHKDWPITTPTISKSCILLWTSCVLSN